MAVMFPFILFSGIFFNTKIEIHPSLRGFSDEPPAIIDYNYDHISEIVLSYPAEGKMTAYHIKTQRGQYIRQINFPDAETRFSSMINLNGGEDKEIAFSYLKNDSLFLVIERIRNPVRWRYFITEVRDMCPPEGWIGHIPRKGVFLVDCENRCLLIVFVITGFDLYPRGFFVIDAETGEILWKFISGAQPAYREVEDINGDRVPEIIIGSFAPCNGSDFNGFDDYSSYLFVFNLKGEMLFNHTIGSYSTSARFIIGDPGPEGVKNIYVAECGGVKEKRERFLYLINGKTGEIIKKRKFYEGISKFEPADINNDGKKEFLLLLFSGRLLVLDGNLNTLKEFEMGKGIHSIQAEDLDLDGDDEIVITRPGKLEIYDRDFKLLAGEEIGDFLPPADWNIFSNFLTDRNSKSVLLYKGKIKREFIIYSFRFKKKINLLLFLIPAIILIILGIFYSGLKTGMLIRKQKTQSPDLTLFYESFHEIKNLMNELSSFILKTGDENVIKKCKKIEEIIFFLNTHIKMTGLKEGETELNELIDEIIERFGKISPGEVSFKKNLDKRIGKIRVSREKMETVLKNLIQNALESMEKGEIYIETRKRRKSVEIIIKDEGEGIEKEKIGKIFAPFYTSKEGHLGLGLYTVKSIITSLKGKIDVESEPGKGTTFKIKLPL